MNKDLQYRCRGPVDINTAWEWQDVPDFWYNLEGNLYLSSVNQLTGHCDIEFRMKPEFEPGWYAIRDGAYSARVTYFVNEPSTEINHYGCRWVPLRDWANDLCDAEEEDDSDPERY